ncbi:MAG: SDR family NAD(P)-dependent oxidoreductase [Candidatus Brocadiae bacterium]|nr:SDR family NAD(P)-dependent oxidoreductase [Candidatus Brocadiia bacterium]
MEIVGKREMPSYDDVAIIGMGCVLPDAMDVLSFWNNASQGKNSITEVPPEKWLAEDYYHPDPKMPGKSYCKIGGFVRGFSFPGLEFGIPPKVCETIDETQKWALSAAKQALMDSGYLHKPFPRERTSVIIGNAIGGEKRVKTILSVSFPEFARAMKKTPEFQKLSGLEQKQFLENLQALYQSQYPAVTEDTMPGELANIISGRIANVFNLGGANFTTDAACASSLAAIQASVQGLQAHNFDMAITGGSDQSMSPDTYIQFCKIGALSGDRSCPFDVSANGFVMGEGSVIFVLKRLGDAEKDGDRIYAVIRAIGSSSDGKGKGITAPNKKGQVSAIQRAYAMAGICPSTISMIEAHGTSTILGDFCEVQSLKEVFETFSLPKESIALGSVKSQIGHLKSAAGAVGVLKATLSLHHRTLLPSINIKQINPKLELEKSPFFVNTLAQPWEKFPNSMRRAGVNSFGFGGTNFHLVLDEYQGSDKKESSRKQKNDQDILDAHPRNQDIPRQKQTRLPQNILVLGAQNQKDLLGRLRSTVFEEKNIPALPFREDLSAPFRMAISFQDEKELKSKAEKISSALIQREEKLILALQNQGVFLGEGKPGKIAFLFPGQGSQYLNMGEKLRNQYPTVARVFEEADSIMASRLDKKLSEYIFIQDKSPEAIQIAEENLKFTRITQPAILAVDLAIWKLLEEFEIRPDMVIGHSLGEYAALVASGILSFGDALIAASGRAKEMSDLRIDDTGIMASVFASPSQIEAVLAKIKGYISLANINSPSQIVIGGETKAVEDALLRFKEMGIHTVKLSVSHAFHTKIVSPAAPRLRKILETMEIQYPRLPIVSNVTGKFYPDQNSDKSRILDLLEEQITSPVQFIQGIETLYEQDARIFVEVGPKKALSGLVSDILGKKNHVAIYSNHPKKDDITALNDLLAALYAQGYGLARERHEEIRLYQQNAVHPQSYKEEENINSISGDFLSMQDKRYLELGQAVGHFLEQMNLFQAKASPSFSLPPAPAPKPEEPLVISGISLGLPGQGRSIFAEENFQRIFAGQNCIESLSLEDRRKMSSKNITRLVKQNNSDPKMETLSSEDDMIHLAGLSGQFDLEKEFGIPQEIVESMNSTTQLSVAAGILALRDAGIPLIRHYHTTQNGLKLHNHWGLPKEMGEETGIVFASAFAGQESLAEEIQKSVSSQSRENILHRMESLWKNTSREVQGTSLGSEIRNWIEQMKREEPYQFHRKFLLRILPLGCAQLAECIRAYGPNTHINSACASTSVALGIAHDWIRMGRCKRVIVVAADNPTGESIREWLLSGFLSVGAASAEKLVELAALPFDRRRNGLIVGMGAVSLVLEHPEELRKRGMRGVSELLGIDYCNSAFHATRLDVNHIKGVFNKFMAKMEQKYNINRFQIAHETMFMSHETYTPARGGSASAEVESLRSVFGDKANHVVIANTKGFTGHAMGAGIEEVVTAKALQIQEIPPIANFKEPDAELGSLNLSQGGRYPIQYALKFSAGFGSQAALALFRRIEGSQVRIESTKVYEKWLQSISQEHSPELEIVQNTLRIRHQKAISVQKEMPKANQESQTKRQEASEAKNNKPVLSQDSVEWEILNLVAEKTGYSTDMLELDLDMEADLGIDSVKQAEIFAMIRERYSLSKKENLQMRDYPTLKQLIGYVKENQQIQTTKPALNLKPVLEKSNVQDKSFLQDSVESEILNLVAEKTGYPAEMLELDLDMEADLGIDSVKQAEIFATIRERYSLSKKENLQMRDYPTLKQLIGYVKENRLSAEVSIVKQEPSLDLSEKQKLETDIQRMSLKVVPDPILKKRTDFSWQNRTVLVVADDERGVCQLLSEKIIQEGAKVVVLAEKNISDSARLYFRKANLDDLQGLQSLCSSLQEEFSDISGIIHLAGLSKEPEMNSLDMDSWNREIRCRVKSLFVVAQSMQKSMEERQGFLVSALCMGGSMGIDSFSAPTPISGGISGLTKALAKEMPQVCVKACDFEAQASSSMIAETLLKEICHGDAKTEICFPGGIRSTVQVIPSPLYPGKSTNISLNQESVLIITGGAQGITSEIAKDLAREFKPKMLLLGLVSLPENIQKFASFSESQWSEFKLELHESLRQQQGRVTPVMLEKELSRYTRAASAYKNIKEIESLGSTVSYRSCDVTDEDAVKKAVSEAVSLYGKIDCIIHGAGIEESKTLANKKLDMFHLVFDVKANGCFHFMRHAQNFGLRSLVLLSSVAGRFGNIGQTDYSAANDLLNKYAAWINENLPGIKAISIDWTGWAGVGMATKENTKKIFEEAGITLIPLKIGASMVKKEILYCGRESEIVVAGNLGFLDRHHQVVLSHPEVQAKEVQESISNKREHFPFLSNVSSYHENHYLEVKRELRMEQDKYLKDHAVEGTPLFPGVMGLEAFAQAACLFCPGLSVVAMEEIRFNKALKIFKEKPVEMRIILESMDEFPDQRRLKAKLVSDFINHEGQKLGETRTHFEAIVVMGQPQGAPNKPALIVHEQGSPDMNKEKIYQILFHGPLFHVCENIYHDKNRGILAKMNLSQNSLFKDTNPVWNIQPLQIELGFQAAGLYEYLNNKRFGLPYMVDKIHFYKQPNAPSQDIHAVAIPAPEDESRFSVEIRNQESVYIEIQGYRTTPML